MNYGVSPSQQQQIGQMVQPKPPAARAGLGGSFASARAQAEPPQPQPMPLPQRGPTMTQARPGVAAGLAGSYRQGQPQPGGPATMVLPGAAPDAGGVRPGIGANPGQGGPPPGASLQEIQAEMARRGVGAQLNANPANSALAGYLMGK